MSNFETLPQQLDLAVEVLDITNIPKAQHHPRLAASPHAARGVLMGIEDSSADVARLHLVEAGVNGHEVAFAAVNARDSMVPISDANTHFLAPYTCGDEQLHVGVNYSLGDASVPLVAVYIRNVAPSWPVEAFADRILGAIGAYAIQKEMKDVPRRKHQFYGLVSVGDEPTVHGQYSLADAARLRRRQ